jgi:uncharacterized membrane protein
MAEELDLLFVIGVTGAILLFIYLYLASVSKVLKLLGFTEGEASTILFVTLFFGWVTLPVFPYNGWWVGLSLGGAILPIGICIRFLLKNRVGVAEAFIGMTIVSYITYTITRAEEGVGIVADVPLAFAPAIAAGLFSVSVFWMDMSKAAPLAYVSGVLGTLIGADVFHLEEILSFEAPSEGFHLLSIGGANIFDMVYLTGIVAVLIAISVYWAKKKQAEIGGGIIANEFRSGAKGLPYARDVPPAPKSTVKKGRLQ